MQRPRIQPKPSLTKRQRDVLEFVEGRITDHGTPPTIREIGARFRIASTNGVRAHLSAIIKKGYLRKHDSLARGLELTRELAGRTARVAVVGTVPAGNPIDAIENVEGEILMDASFIPKGNTFSLRVNGDSMKDAGIYDGDFVVVRKQNVANKGEIVVALLNGEATVKRYFPEGKSVRLQPENDSFKSIIIHKDSGDFEIAGKVVGLIRKFA